MTQGSISLHDLLKPDFKQAVKIGWQDAEKEEKMQKIRETLESEISDLEWDTVKQEIYLQLDKLLDISLGVVFARVWVKSKQIKQIIEKQNKEMTGDIVVVPLPIHKIHSKHEPRLKIVLNDLQIGVLPLMAKFVFKLDGVLLKIQYGKIQSILSGKCKGIASLTYQDTDLEEKEISEFDLSEHINVIKTSEERVAEDKALADDIMTENRIVDDYDVKISSEEEVVSYIPISLGKKIFLLIVGVFISLMMIAAVMLLL